MNDIDLERRFGGVRRLYGAAGARRIAASRVVVVGLGGVGSWAVEALARTGVGALVLIDLDHVAESNLNRQLQATQATLGMAKPAALAQRIALIHPDCDVQCIEAFVGADNWPGLVDGRIDALLDACDQVRAKLALAQWARRTGVPLVCAGAAGGKRRAEQVEVADLAETTHDPLLAALRQRLRQAGAPRRGKLGVRCVFSREPVAPPVDTADCSTDGSLNCHGYGSTVTVTATFGMVAAGALLEQLAHTTPRP